MDSKSHNLQMTLRFTDKYCDILCFISLRVLSEKYGSYFDVLKTMPDTFLNELETLIQYYEDLFVLILDVSGGKKTYCECKEFINEIWGSLE